MPFDSDTSIQDSSTNVCELTQDDLAAVSGGKPKQNPHSQTEFLKVVMKEVLITGY
jgi:bacteriocin-like protein